MRTVRLKARRRIGVKMFRVVYSESIKRSRADVRDPGKVTALFRFERMKAALRVFVRSWLENNIDLLCLRCPKSKVGLVWLNQLGANRITAFLFGRVHRPFSRSRARPAVLQSGFSFHLRSIINNDGARPRAFLSRSETLHEIPRPRLIPGTKPVGITAWTRSNPRSRSSSLSAKRSS